MRREGESAAGYSPDKKRALAVYGDENGEDNAWNIPLIPNNSSFDLTKDDNGTTASTDTISQLTQDLPFLRKDFNESIKITNVYEYIGWKFNYVH